jgi:hypothetical protein
LENEVKPNLFQVGAQQGQQQLLRLRVEQPEIFDPKNCGLSEKQGYRLSNYWIVVHRDVSITVKIGMQRCGSGSRTGLKT